MISLAALKNIQIQEFEDFFREHKVPKWTVRISAGSTIQKYDKVRQIIQEELALEKPSFTYDEIDEFIFEKLFYANSNYQMVFRYNSFFGDVHLNSDEVNEYLAQNTNIEYLKNLINWVDNTDLINLCTVRSEFTTRRTLKAIHILLRIDTLDQLYGKRVAFCGVTVNVRQRLVILRFSHQQFELIKTEPLKLIKQILDTLGGIGTEGKKFEPLQLNINQISEDDSTSAIYELFAELSSEAEEILHSRVTKETEKKIVSFLNDLKVKEVKKEYIEQIKNVVYQDIADSMEDTAFEKGWIFKFQFREGDHTKASSRNDKRLPVYTA
ncbi:hypothetical protein D7Z26_06720 [Cohnella endophytica]|uniref:Uncharacterized protein n=1 Tax=Cohnella endophytica TaxID=2419778 RepID=A0A494XYU6_9BACL|nr:hypothetical protein [Cohnella endophytica]RKP54928.1 hypothetical protein D7Z26_06720 [Cohnella endophytica]